MHGTFRTELAEETEDWQGFPVSSSRDRIVPAPAIERSVYGARRPNWPLIVLILAGHVALLGMLIMFDVIPVNKLKAEPLVVDLVELQVTPPPQKVEKVPPVTKVTPQIVAPVQIVQTPAPAPQLAIVQDAPPAPPIVVPPAPSGPVSVNDLDTKMISMVAPRYPMESRRSKEQGTVVLAIMLAADGTVAEIHVSQSSGYSRLDKAALDAVRKWRWSTTMRGGVPVMVRGFVPIPFILKA